MLCLSSYFCCDLYSIPMLVIFLGYSSNVYIQSVLPKSDKKYLIPIFISRVLILNLLFSVLMYLWCIFIKISMYSEVLLLLALISSVRSSITQSANFGYFANLRATTCLRPFFKISEDPWSSSLNGDLKKIKFSLHINPDYMGISFKPCGVYLRYSYLYDSINIPQPLSSTNWTGIIGSSMAWIFAMAISRSS